MRCGHVADANLATTNPPTLCRYTGLQRPVSVNRAGPRIGRSWRRQLGPNTVASGHPDDAADLMTHQPTAERAKR
jgi:hypothetical protein